MNDKTIKTLSITLPQGMYNMCCSSGDEESSTIYLLGGTSPSEGVSRFNAQFDVENGTLQLLNQNIHDKFPIINDEYLKIEIGVGMALLGGSANIGREVEYLIYDGVKWK